MTPSDIFETYFLFNHLIPKLFADVVVIEGRTALRLVVAVILKALHGDLKIFSSVLGFNTKRQNEP